MSTRKRVIDLPPVTGRLEITSLADYVDETMEHMGSGKIDLTDPRARERFRDWLLSVLSHYLARVESDLSKGADRGVRQVLALARDPDYYTTASRRRQMRRAAQQRASEEATQASKVWLSQRQAEQDAFKAAIDAGTVRLFPGTVVEPSS